MTAVKLSIEQVDHVADLVRLALTDQERETFRLQLSAILEYAGRLRRLDTGGIPLTTAVLPLENVMRDDEVQPSLPVEDVLANAPAVEDGCFRVPVILPTPLAAGPEDGP
ncbi:MAG: Asp-tRNA(Asn)/Glu-tRNA(Gln) amidotransferase subunit GatC [Anaerolineae bacterium]|nr:Asp-tRNA(Asn)/Glu-tRNA(Gln) amidotransferase subunit GatC [Anaerolineae bacterium]